MDEIMRSCGVLAVQRWAINAGLKVGGHLAWRRHSRPNKPYAKVLNARRVEVRFVDERVSQRSG